MILRRVDAWFCDPLELRPDSQLGRARAGRGLPAGAPSRSSTPSAPACSRTPGCCRSSPPWPGHLLGHDLRLPLGADAGGAGTTTGRAARPGPPRRAGAQARSAGCPTGASRRRSGGPPRSGRARRPAAPDRGRAPSLGRPGAGGARLDADPHRGRAGRPAPASCAPSPWPAATPTRPCPAASPGWLPDQDGPGHPACGAHVEGHLGAGVGARAADRVLAPGRSRRRGRRPRGVDVVPRRPRTSSGSAATPSGPRPSSACCGSCATGATTSSTGRTPPGGRRWPCSSTPCPTSPARRPASTTRARRPARCRRPPPRAPSSARSWSTSTAPAPSPTRPAGCSTRPGPCATSSPATPGRCSPPSTTDLLGPAAATYPRAVRQATLGGALQALLGLSGLTAESMVHDPGLALHGGRPPARAGPQPGPAAAGHGHHRPGHGHRLARAGVRPHRGREHHHLPPPLPVPRPRWRRCSTCWSSTPTTPGRWPTRSRGWATASTPCPTTTATAASRPRGRRVLETATAVRVADTRALAATGDGPTSGPDRPELVAFLDGQVVGLRRAADAIELRPLHPRSSPQRSLVPAAGARR